MKMRVTLLKEEKWKFVSHTIREYLISKSKRYPITGQCSISVSSENVRKPGWNIDAKWVNNLRVGKFICCLKAADLLLYEKMNLSASQ